jgi:hypothetical protein
MTSKYSKLNMSATNDRIFLVLSGKSEENSSVALLSPACQPDNVGLQYWLRTAAVTFVKASTMGRVDSIQAATVYQTSSLASG